MKPIRKKNFLFQSLIGGAVLAMVIKVVASRLTQAKPSPRRASGAMSFEEIDAYIEAKLKHLNVPGAALAIVEGDKIVHLRSFGQASPGGAAPSPQTPFVLGSTTKSFTALAVMQLVEAGRVELDAPVQRYLPWFRVADPQASAQMTVRHLLNQTSGLPVLSGWTTLADFDNRPDATQRQARALATLKLTRPVGSAFEYNNMNYNVLGLIIEAASHESYADYIQKHIFNPLGMSHSFTSQAAAKQDGLATGHRYWFWLPLAAPNLPIPRGSLPSGQLISSAEDMAQYLTAYLNGGRYGDVQILSGAGTDELCRGAADFRALGVTVGKYGMGWIVTEIGQTKIIYHSGCVPDFSSYMALLPEQKRGVVLLLNAGHFMMEPVMTEFGMDVAALIAGQQPAPSPFGFVRFIPWAMRLFLLIPLLQIAGVVATLRLLHGYRQDKVLRPSSGRMWGAHILLPLIPNLSLAAVPILLRTSGIHGFLWFFAPDFSLITLICGGFAGVWTFLRTRLILRAHRKTSSF